MREQLSDVFGALTPHSRLTSSRPRVPVYRNAIIPEGVNDVIHHDFGVS